MENKLWYIHAVEQYSAIRRKKLLTHTISINLKNITLGEWSQTRKSTHRMTLFAWTSIRCQLTCGGGRETGAHPGLEECAERQSWGTGDLGGWRKYCVSWRCGGYAGVDAWTKNGSCSMTKRRMWQPSSHQPLRPPSSVHPEGGWDEEIRILSRDG